MRIKKALKLLFLLLLILVLAAGSLKFYKPLPEIPPTTIAKSNTNAATVNLPWPNYGQAAIGATGFGILSTNGAQQPAPIASVAKVVTALAVLKKKPLVQDRQGPFITIGMNDVISYNDYYAKGGTVAKVVVNEKISQYQALQGMLLPSANNLADTLAVWAFGSLEEYITYANSYVKSIGLTNTHIADASGFSPQTLSTAHDLVLLGEKAIQNPILASIVSQQQATIPEAGIIKNTNWLLGEDGVIGIKTGNTGEAGGCYLFAAKKKIGSEDIILLGAILGSPERNRVISDSRYLIQESIKGFHTVTPVRAGEIVGNYSAPWGAKSQAVAKETLQILSWQGQPLKITTKLRRATAGSAKNSTVGTLSVSSNKKIITTDAVLNQKITKPSFKWRITNN